MKNILIAFIKEHNKCKHKNALLSQEEGYCPDCGVYLKKNYYIIRCSRCDIKREAKIVWDEILPKEKYCENCGETEFYIEKIDKINFIDAQYALCIKEIVRNIQNIHPETQIWVNDEERRVKQICAKNLF